MSSPVYLDHNASSPLRPVALEAMLPYLTGPACNPSSVHSDGNRARAALDRARGALAGALGADSEELVFVSSGTEANNLALAGVAATTGRGGSGRLICSAVEHPSVLKAAAEAASSSDLELILISPDSQGRIDPDDIAAALTPDTRLVSLQMVNHELGTIQPVAEVASLLDAHPALFHVDAVQAFGRMPIDVHRLPVDLLSLSAHKIGGPVGIGILYIRAGVSLRPLLHGGGQEGGLRAGTQAVALAVGLAAAAREALEEQTAVAERLAAHRCWLMDRIASLFPGARLLSPDHGSVPGTLNILFPGVDRERLLVNLDLEGVRLSTGAACASGSVETSPVLRAIGLSEQDAASAVRVSMGSTTSRTCLERLVSALRVALPRSRNDAMFF